MLFPWSDCHGNHLMLLNHVQLGNLTTNGARLSVARSLLSWLRGFHGAVSEPGGSVLGLYFTVGWIYRMKLLV